jgi:hypothetical protein
VGAAPPPESGVGATGDELGDDAGDCANAAQWLVVSAAMNKGFKSCIV